MFLILLTGTQLLFSEEGLRDVLLKPLFSDDEMLEETHSIALHLLSSATSVLDSVAFLQASFKYQVGYFVLFNNSVAAIIAPYNECSNAFLDCIETLFPPC